NIEVVYAPDFTSEALEVLASRKPLRLVKMGAALETKASDSGLEFKRVAGGILVQKRFDSKIISLESIDVVSERKATQEEIEAAIFNWNIACFTRSNAIVIGQEDKVHGIGSGQRSRIDAAETAIRYSRRGYGPEVREGVAIPCFFKSPFWRLSPSDSAGHLMLNQDTD
ncbi:hypothetical protein GH153_07380, partial [bacterium]|nr:hypothetical protein [bacterium]